MSPAPTGSSAIRFFEGSDAIEIDDGITFGFYTGLPHMHIDNYVTHLKIPIVTRNKLQGHLQGLGHPISVWDEY